MSSAALGIRQVKYTNKAFWRNPASAFFTFACPIMFLIIFTTLFGNHQVQVSHGFASGLNPNQALVFLLQLRGDQQVSRDFVQRQLPMDIDITQMQAQIDIEQVEDALKQGVFGLLSSAGIMVQQGMEKYRTSIQRVKLPRYGQRRRRASRPASRGRSLSRTVSRRSLVLVKKRKC